MSGLRGLKPDFWGIKPGLKGLNPGLRGLKLGLRSLKDLKPGLRGPTGLK